jgi:hypothetical protein
MMTKKARGAKTFTVGLGRCALAVTVLMAWGGALHAQSAAKAVPKSAAEQAKAWTQMSKLPDLWQGTWLSISPIADDFSAPGDYTPFALEYIKKYVPTDDSPFANCTPLGMPYAMNIGGMPMKFFQSPGMIALYIESSGAFRFIHMDGRKHSDRPNPTFMGESIGHWEGDTLVVDTTGLLPGTLFQIGKQGKDVARQGDPSPMAGVIFGPHGPKMRLVERMRLVNFNTLENQTTIYDDTIFKQPYAVPPRRYSRGIERLNEPQEWVCSDNRDYIDPVTGRLEINVKDKARSSAK